MDGSGLLCNINCTCMDRMIRRNEWNGLKEEPSLSLQFVICCPEVRIVQIIWTIGILSES